MRSKRSCPEARYTAATGGISGMPPTRESLSLRGLAPVVEMNHFLVSAQKALDLAFGNQPWRGRGDGRISPRRMSANALGGGFRHGRRRPAQWRHGGVVGQHEEVAGPVDRIPAWCGLDWNGHRSVFQKPRVSPLGFQSHTGAWNLSIAPWFFQLVKSPMCGCGGCRASPAGLDLHQRAVV